MQKFLFSLALITSFACNASTRYVNAGVGINKFEFFKHASSEEFYQKATLPKKAVYTLGAGADVSKHMRMSLDFFYTDFKYHYERKRSGGAASTFHLQKSRIYNLMLNFYLQKNLTQFVQAYAKAGLGIGYQQAKQIHEYTPNIPMQNPMPFKDKKKFAPAYSVGFGSRVKLSKDGKHGLDLGYAYSYLAKTQIGSKARYFRAHSILCSLFYKI